MHPSARRCAGRANKKQSERGSESKMRMEVKRRAQPARGGVQRTEHNCEVSAFDCARSLQPRTLTLLLNVVAETRSDHRLIPTSTLWTGSARRSATSRHRGPSVLEGRGSDCAGICQAARPSSKEERWKVLASRPGRLSLPVKTELAWIPAVHPHHLQLRLFSRPRLVESSKRV